MNQHIQVNTAYLSLGSNVDRRHNITRSLEVLANEFGDLKCSSVYQCPSAGFVGNDFYNLAVSFETTFSAEVISAKLKQIEADLGRLRQGPKFSDRLIDIDLLMLGQLVGQYGNITLPRDDVYRYYFVLGPLVELAPALLDPVSGQAISILWSKMQTQLTDEERLIKVSIESDA